MSALGISGRIQSAHDRLVKRACIHLAICRCLPATGWPRLDCTVNTGKRQAGFLTTVRWGLENTLDGYMGDIFGSSRRGAGDLWTHSLSSHAVRKWNWEPAGTIRGTLLCTQWRRAAGGVTQRRGDCSGLATMQLFLVCMHTRFCGAGIPTSPHASKTDLFALKYSCRNICNPDKTTCYTANFFHYRRSQLWGITLTLPSLLRHHNMVNS